MLKLLLIVAILAVTIYLLLRVIALRGVRLRPPPPPGRPIGPDDDPDFLWDLDRKKRHPDEE